MNLVFLDASTIHHGDLDLARLATFGHLTCHPTTTAQETIARAHAADILITNKVVISREVFAACPNLRLVVIAATGTNCVDLDAARDHHVVVSNVSGYSTDSVAQHAIGMLINLASQIHRYDQHVRTAWPASPIFTRLDFPVTELAGTTLGIVGLGSIGQKVATIASAIGMHTVALARPGQPLSGTTPTTAAIPRLPASEFFAHADAISLHCPLTPQTHHLINAEVLTQMKQSAFLINTGRGPLIDEAALAAALRSGDIAGAALDVLTTEPPAPDHPLLAQDIPNLLITPHTAWTSSQARRRLLDAIHSNIQAFLDGSPANRVA